MGIGFVLLIYLVVGLVVASVGSAILRRLAGVFLPESAAGRGRLLRTASYFPFMCLVWAGCVLSFWAAIDEKYLHRGVGLGDVLECPLPLGYKLTCVDETDIGVVERIGGGVKIDCVREMQFSGPWLLAASDTQWIQHFAERELREDEWHIVDTRTQSEEGFRTRAEFNSAAQRLGVPLHLETVGSFYSKNQFSWFDGFAGLLLIGVPIAAIFLFVRRFIPRRLAV